jgi:hypothetical protein
MRYVGGRECWRCYRFATMWGFSEIREAKTALVPKRASALSLYLEPSCFCMCMGDDVNLVSQLTTRLSYTANLRRSSHPLACERRPCTRRDYHEQECRNARLPVARRRWPAANTRRCASAGSAGNMGTVAVGLEARHPKADNCFKLTCLWTIDNHEFGFDYALTVSRTGSHFPTTSVVTLTPHWTSSAKCV